MQMTGSKPAPVIEAKTSSELTGKIVAAPKLTANNPTNPYSSHMFPFRFFPKFFYKSSFTAKIKQNRGTARKKRHKRKYSAVLQTPGKIISDAALKLR